MNRQIKILIIFTISWASLLLTSCAGISVMEFQDAETLGKRNSSMGIGISGGVNTIELYNDSAKTMNRYGAAFIPLQATFQTGLSDNMDISASLWNSSLLSYFVRFTANFNSYSDLGASLSLKYRITPQEATRNLAFTVTLLEQSGHYDHDDGGWKASTYGFVPGFIYSRKFLEPVSPADSLKKSKLFNVLNTLYAGCKVYFISTNIEYTFPSSPSEIHIREHPIIYDPFVGASFGQERRYYFELHGMFMKNPFSGDIDIMPYFGMGTKFYF